MGPIGAQEMIFIVIFALLIFGPKKLPELGRLLGKGLTEFRRAKNELKTTFDSHMQELERETRLSEHAESSKIGPASSVPYPYPYDEYGGASNDTPAPSTEPAHAPVESSAPEEEPHLPSSPPHTQPVSGTVPRSKAVQNGDHDLSVAAEENRTA